MALFRQLHEAGSTIIMITHDPGIASYADKVYHIFDGVLTGDASEVRAAAKANEELWAHAQEDLGAGNEGKTAGSA